MHDFRYAARVLGRTPVFTIVAAGLLAVGIGANTVIFSAADAVMLRPLAVRHPEELVRIVQKTPQLGARSSFLYLFYEALRDHSTTLSTVFGEQEFRVAMNEPRPAEQIQVMAVTPEFFDALARPALYGRALTVEDGAENPGMIPAVLSYGFWRRRFNRDPRAVGQTITLHEHKFVITGVMPRDFNGTSIDVSPEVRVPLRAAPLLIDWGGHPPAATELVNLSLAARLKPGVTRAQARAECLALWRAATERFFQGRTDQPAGALEEELRRGLDLDPLDRGTSILRDRFGAAIKLLATSVALLLVMVCANLAGLLLARGASRRDDIAVRLALGATRARLVRQFLAEACVIAGLGSAGGILLALLTNPLLIGALPPVRDLYTARVAVSAAIAVNWRVLLFSLGASAAAVLLFGLPPAIGSSRVNLDGALRGARASSRLQGRRALIVFQIALCTLLLSGAALLARSWQQLRSVEPGFDRDHIVTFTADPSLAGYNPPQARSLRLALMERVRELPGVASVAVASRPLMRGSGVKMTVAPEGQLPTAADFLNTSLNTVTPGYFETMGMRILAGRDLTPADERNQKPPRSVVVNQAFAVKFFPGESAIGRRFGNPRWAENNQIVGVVNDAKYRSLREPMTPVFYNVWTDEAVEPFQLEVRTSGRPEAVIEPVRRVLAALDPALPFLEIGTMSAEMEASAAGERLTAALATIFSGVAAFLAAIGIYGLFAYAVAQRRREIGVRMALGARPIDIGGMIGCESFVTVAGGIAAGLCAAAFAAPLMRSVLYGIAPWNPWSFAPAALLVAVVAAIATSIPARRAMRTDPATVLRQER